MRQIALMVVFCGSTVAIAGPSSDQFTSYADVKLRVAPDTIKTFAKQWAAVHETARRKSVVQYLLKAPPPAFEGVRVDKALVSVSQHLDAVVGIALSLSGESCPQLKKVLDHVWGPAFDVGGREHELEWKGARVDASVTDDGPTKCLLFIGDLGYDDEKDEWKKKR